MASRAFSPKWDQEIIVRRAAAGTQTTTVPERTRPRQRTPMDGAIAVIHRPLPVMTTT